MGAWNGETPPTLTRTLLTPRAGHDGCSRGAASSCRSLHGDMGTVRQGFSSLHSAGPATALQGLTV